MELFERFDELSRTVDAMNAEATHNACIPYLRLHEYIHYCDVKLFLFGYTRRLCMSEAERTEKKKAFEAYKAMPPKNAGGDAFDKIVNLANTPNSRL